MAKKQSDDSEYRQLKKDISSDSIGQLYLFWGEESYLREYYLNAMTEKLISPELTDFNYRIFEGADTEIVAVASSVDTVPMLSERTMTVVRGLDIFANEDIRSQTEELISELPEYCCLVFVFDDELGKPPATTKLYKSISKLGHIVEFAAQTQSDLISWISRRFKAYDCVISRSNAEYLLFLCGSLMNGLIPEIEKISAYNGSGEVSREAIDAATVPMPSAVVFRMTDAIAQKDFDRAAEIMGELIASKEHPIMLLSLISRQLRQLYTARLMYDRGKGETDIKALWKLSNDYAARTILRCARGFSAALLRWSLVLCAETDLEMKSTGADAEGLLYGFFIRLAAEVSSAS